MLTAQALARNSDIFKAGVDLAGVHLWGSSLDPESVSFKSSAIGAIDGWKSPVLLVHGDDDRNVAFQQTTGLVQLLRARNVEYELIVFPDDTHESMLHSRWMYTLDRMEKFLDEASWRDEEDHHRRRRDCTIARIADWTDCDLTGSLTGIAWIANRQSQIRQSSIGIRQSAIVTWSTPPCRCSTGFE